MPSGGRKRGVEPVVHRGAIGSSPMDDDPRPMPNGHELLAKELHAAHPGLGAASAVVAGPRPPDRPPEPSSGARRLGAGPPHRGRTGAVLLRRLRAPAGWDDRVGAPAGDGAPAGAGIAGAVGGDGCDLLACRDLAEQISQHGRIAHAAAGDLDGPDLKRALVDGEVDLAPNPPARPAMLARGPFADPASFDAGVAYQRVERIAGEPRIAGGPV